MRFINPSQCRAARGLLKWSQPDLSKRCGINVQTICAFENETGTPTKRTLEKIRSSFEYAGIVLTEDGVSKPDTTSITFTGKTWFVDFLEDVYQTLLREDNKELLIMNGDNRISPPEVFNAFKRLRQSGVHIREMVEEGNSFLHGPESDYRWIPSQYFMNFNTIIYADKVLTDFNTHGILFKNKRRAEADRRNFNLIWSLLPELSIKSTADVRY